MMKSLGVKGFIIGGIVLICSVYPTNSETLIPSNIKLAGGIGLIIYGVLRLIKQRRDTRQS